MQQYLQSLQDILDHGHSHPDRTKVGRISIFGYQERYRLEDSFPLVTTRKVATKAMIQELLWFIQGETNTKKGGCPSFWDKWAVDNQHIDSFVKKALEGTPATEQDIERIKLELSDKYLGSIGPMYGHLWRNAPISGELVRSHRTLSQLPSDKLKLYKEEYEELLFLSREETPIPFIQYANNRYWQSIDQLNELIINLRERPHSSRHCITAWIPEFVPPETMTPQEAVLNGYGSLASCHAFFQFFVHPAKDGGKMTLDCQLYIRSQDDPVGKPYNIAQYALLLAMVAQVVGMTPGTFILTTGDMHIYTNQVEGVQEQLTRTPRPLPTLVLNPEVDDLFAFTLDDIKIEGYDPHPHIAYPVAV